MSTSLYNRTFISLFLLPMLLSLTTAGLAQEKKRTATAGESSEVEDIIGRQKFLYTRRAGGPGKVIPDNAFAEAVAEKNRHDRNRKASDKALFSSGSWVSVNPSGMFYQRTGNNHIAGRTNAIAFHPTDPNIMYSGAAGGGVWKTTDGGLTWRVLTDGLSSIACGAIAVDPNNPNVVYFGTGELNFSFDSYYGDGLYKSTDAGESWTRIVSVALGKYYSQIAIDPSNSNIVYVGTDKNVYKSTNAGSVWNGTGCGANVNCVVLNPSNPQIIYATINGYDNNEVRKSTNGGGTWTTLGGGLPSGGSRTQLAISQSNPNVLYASVAAPGDFSLHGLYRTNDGGTTWTLQANSPNYLGTQGWYDNAIAVHPTNPDIVIAGGLDVYSSVDGGVTLDQKSVWWTTSSSQMSHADIHFLGYNGATLYCGSDGGVYKSTDDGQSWSDLNEEISTLQYMSADYDPSNPLKMYGGTQDNNKMTTTNGGTTWIQRTTGDGGYTVVDFVSPNIVYGQYVNGSLDRSSNSGGSFTGIEPSEATGGLFYNPYEMAPGNHNVIVYGVSQAWKTTTATTASSGSGWEMIAPSSVIAGNVSAIGISRQTVQKIYLGNDIGELMVTTNNGAVWQKTSGFPYVTDIAVDRDNDAIAYATCGGFTRTKHVYKTTNSGATWTSIVGDLPNIPVNSIVIRSTEPRILFLGTDLGVYASMDEGAHWSVFGNGLPSVAVFDLKYKENNYLLLAATHGRGCFTYQLSGAIYEQSVSALDLGFVELGTSATDSFVVRNTGITTLEISSATTTNPLFSVEPSSASIPSADSAMFYLSFAPSGLGAESTMVLLGHNALSSPDTLNGVAHGVGALFSAGPPVIDYGNAYTGAIENDTIIVNNPGSQPLTISAATTDASEFSITPVSAVMAPAESDTFVVAYAPTSFGSHEANIIFTHDAYTSPDTISAGGRAAFAFLTVHKFTDNMDGNILTTTDQAPKRWRLRVYKDSVGGIPVASLDSSSLDVPLEGPGTYIVTEADSGAEWVRIGAREALSDTFNISVNSTLADTFVNMKQVDVAFTVAERWNIVSLPVGVPNDSAHVLFPSKTTDAYSFDPNVGYVESSRLTNGSGYWMKFDTAETYSFASIGISSVTIPVSEGWNMIGSISSPVSATEITTDPPGGIGSFFFEYDNGYKVAEVLSPGKGYWVRLGAEGALTIAPDEGSTATKSAAVIFEGYNSLTITDAVGNTQTLWIGEEQSETRSRDWFGVPPVPPSGVFDVRFASQRMAETYSRESLARTEFAIEISSAQSPVSLSWEIREGTGREFSIINGATRVVRGRGSVVLNESSPVALAVQLGREVPSIFALRQNYPNPFNPSTIVQFDLPEDALVTLTVYDILGKEVMTVMDRKPYWAGSRQAEIMADGLPSGVYVYKVTAESSENASTIFKGMKKMMVIK